MANQPVNPHVGEIVHYVLSTADVGPFAQGEARPAIIVHVWDENAGTVNLQVFTDNLNDELEENTLWATSRSYDGDGRPGTWHRREEEA